MRRRNTTVAGRPSGALKSMPSGAKPSAINGRSRPAIAAWGTATSSPRPVDAVAERLLERLRELLDRSRRGRRLQAFQPGPAAQERGKILLVHAAQEELHDGPA